ncbi:hypothetical protein JCM33374_g5589 [Metschnikowia sp. JCM 33374]|nr:hypothetical protein JCM33374_g5589 [Metschnikowia sp. JCM 33374]
MFGFKFLYYLRKKVVINALIVLLFVQAILLTHFHLFGPIIDVQVVLDKLLQPSTFHRKASKLLAQIQKDPERFWITNSDLTHLETEIPVEKILVEEGTEGPGEVFYDPRFTIAAYLDELSRVGQSEEVPTLPFHWVDWMDATFSDTQIGKTQTKHMPCSFLQDKIRGKP